MISKRGLCCLSILISLFWASGGEGAIPRPSRIFGTVTVDGTVLTQNNDDGYSIEVTRPDGSAFEPAATLPDGLNYPAGYSINIPLYDAIDQPGGAVPNETAVIHVYKYGSKLTIISPGNGSFTVGEVGSIHQMNLAVTTPTPTRYQLAVGVVGGHGTVTPSSGSYDKGTVVTLTASPDAGHRVLAWSGTDNDSSVSNTNTVTMNTNRSVTVQFEAIPATQYQLTARVSGGHGTISPTGGDFNQGVVVTLTASPDAGYRVLAWSGTDNDSSASNTNTVTMNTNRSVTVSFAPNLPEIISFVATPSRISEGQFVTLTWSIVGATSAGISDGVGAVVPSSGSVQASPTSTKTYTLTASNAAGSVTRTATVTVEDSSSLPTINTFAATPDTINPGESAILSWAVGGATSARINNGVGAVDPSSGSQQLAPESTTTYVLTATNAEGSVTATVTVTVPDFSPPEIVETIPHDGAGIHDLSRVPNDSSFCVRIEAPNGIDITDPTSVRFTIDDGFQTEYVRDLNDISVVRVIKLTDEVETQVTKLWVAYDRSGEDGFETYSYDTQINIKVDVRGSTGLEMPRESYSLGIETKESHNAAETATPSTVQLEPSDADFVDSQYFYDSGIEVTDGDLKGAKIIYDSSEPIQPKFGPINEIPPLNAESVGVPMNLQPPNVFNTPVKLLIPYPGYSDVSALCIYLFSGDRWSLACDADGNIQPGGEGWMVPGSRVNHNNGNPSTIEIKVYHFSAVQAASADAGGDDSCFISTSRPTHRCLSAWRVKWVERLRGLKGILRRHGATR